MELYTGTDSVNADLAKCRSKQGDRLSGLLLRITTRKIKLLMLSRLSLCQYLWGVRYE